ALTGPDVEGAARSQAGDLVHERAVGVAAPDRVVPVPAIPVGLLRRRPIGVAAVVLRQLELEPGPDAAAVGGARFAPTLGHEADQAVRELAVSRSRRSQGTAGHDRVPADEVDADVAVAQ